MGRIYWFGLITSAMLLGSDKVELYSEKVDINGSQAHVTGNPFILYQDQLLSADVLMYDHNHSVVEANGSVNIFKAGQYHGISDYLRMDLANETRYSRPYYMLDQSIGLWMSAKEALGCKNEVDLIGGTVSGCDSVDPIWKIRFSSADYDSDAMWINLYNARLEVNDIPLFYLPYFGYPTDKTRRSGLLIPSFAISNAEGFYYQQPIYFAPQHWWDVELRPQIRTTRGSGLYSDLRFVDTRSSEGNIRLGYFKEQRGYVKEYDLANSEHYGYNVHYRHRAWMNDVDYLNLQQTDETRNVTSNQIISRINGYYSGENNYFGAYFKHYQYLDKEDNSQTIQTLPSLHYHRYLESFFENHLLINTDIMATDFYRSNGKKAIVGDFNLPLTLQTSIFDEFVDVSYIANLSSKMIGFYGDPKDGDANEYTNGLYAQLDHTFSVSSTLIRPYEGFTHVISPFVSYTSAGSRHYNGYYETFHNSEECISGNTNPACEYYTLNEPSDSLYIGLNNYLFANGKQFFMNRVSQNIQYDNEQNNYGELQNELEWEFSDTLSYYNQTAYNHDRERITKEQNTLRYNDEVVTAGVSHYYTDELSNSTPVYTSYWTADAAYQVNHNYRMFGQIAYDYHEELFKRSEIGFLYTQRCLDLGLRYVQNRRPILTNASANDSVNDSYIFITVILKPIGGSEFSYKLTRN
jgi:LPS-assembly protein